MEKEKTDSQIDKGKNKYKNFRCPEDYLNCEFYNPKQPEESRCIKDSNIGCCVQEYFDYYNEYEVIIEYGDLR